MIHVSEEIALNEKDIAEKFSRGFGPGVKSHPRRQTIVQASIDLGKIQISDRAAERLLALAGRHITKDGTLVVEARPGESQAQNRKVAQARLLKLLERAGTEPAPRKATKPRRAVGKARRTAKERTSALKRSRHATE